MYKNKQGKKTPSTVSLTDDDSGSSVLDVRFR